MLYGTPSLAPARQHRSLRRIRRRAARRPERAAEILVRGLGGLILLALLAVGVFFVVAGEQHRADPPAPAGGPPVAADALDSRQVDTAPLSIEEIFPDQAAVRPAAASPYRITMTHLDADCRSAAFGELAALLAAHGCDQVVRAGLVAPYGGYQVTAGVFDLADAAGAEYVDGRLRHVVETGDGTFTTLPTTNPDPYALPTSQVGWRARGHYLLYCVINRPDGAVVTADDPYAARITSDLVDSYLGTTVLGRRAAAMSAAP
ncbi:hypothetical protein ODJ79_06020 [Actinoplanes sp. KI2]|uniref:hypothetical protein n=1 Tax=Actinoplanes sp. KI2 TaxID=2983315 RepID=UPI0021D5C037|nr:hypothetical protein [Actinoplanes sp. KI2]MCU7723261.1 hypothetical protein [Actinoplanes sp. KI2]